MVLALALAARGESRVGETGRRGVTLAGFAIEAGAIGGRVMGLVFWQCGYFLIGSAEALAVRGLGCYSMNLLGPVMGMGYSTLLPGDSAAPPGQYEGHVYFGLGWLLVSAVAIVVAARRRGSMPRLGLGWLAVAACTALAVSPVVTFGATTLVDLNALGAGQPGDVPLERPLRLGARCMPSSH